MRSLRDWAALLREAVNLPSLRIALHANEAAEHDPHHHALTQAFYRHATSWHPKWWGIRRMQFGVALCHLPDSVEGYRAQLPQTGLRNIRKAERLGYHFRRIEFNDHLDAITRIHRSAPTRQGRPLPSHLLEDTRPCTTPASRCNSHDYPFFGVFDRDGQLVAYAGCFVAGELCNIDRVFGHHDRLPDGVVPLLIASIAEHTIAHHPGVRYFTYGTYFGATETMRRFKRKFQFHPHRVKWLLNRSGVPVLIQGLMELLLDDGALTSLLSATSYLA